jgi:dihydroorotase
MSLLIKNGRVIDPASGTDETLDILVESGRIVELKAKIEPGGSRVIDASRLVVCPGFIDLHAHLREPGQEHKEDIRTASLAAAKGGFTSICAMPNTTPVNDHRAITEYILAAAKKKSLISVFPIAAITRGLNGQELTDMADLIGAGAVAFSDDGRGVQNSQIMRQALEQAAALNVLIIEHCEDQNLSRDGLVHQGAASALLGLKGIPGSAEDVMVARDIILTGASRSRLHIAHLSSRGAVDLVREAKKRNIQVTAEATPHHLVLTDASLSRPDPNLKVNPPLRGPEDARALLDAVQAGVIDVFATDHAPHTPEEKNVDFDRAPFGIAGLETAVSLLLDRLVNKNLISLARFVDMLSTAPARILGLKNKGRIAAGADADLTLLSLSKDITVDVQLFASKSRNNPFHGWKLRGAPVMTVAAGNIVYPFA